MVTSGQLPEHCNDRIAKPAQPAFEATTFKTLDLSARAGMSHEDSSSTLMNSIPDLR